MRLKLFSSKCIMRSLDTSGVLGIFSIIVAVMFSHLEKTWFDVSAAFMSCNLILNMRSDSASCLSSWGTIVPLSLLSSCLNSAFMNPRCSPDGEVNIASFHLLYPALISPGLRKGEIEFGRFILVEWRRIIFTALVVFMLSMSNVPFSISSLDWDVA